VALGCSGSAFRSGPRGTRKRRWGLKCSADPPVSRCRDAVMGISMSLLRVPEVLNAGSGSSA
jgi:hypothetical protein